MSPPPAVWGIQRSAEYPSGARVNGSGAKTNLAYLAHLNLELSPVNHIYVARGSLTSLGAPEQLAAEVSADSGVLMLT